MLFRYLLFAVCLSIALTASGNDNFPATSELEQTLADSANKKLRWIFRDGPADGEFASGVLVRTYYSNDGRLQWTGEESTFGAEGILTPFIRINTGTHQQLTAAGEFYINQPTDKNFYLDSGTNIHPTSGGYDTRGSYYANFDKETVEVSQLFLNYEAAYYNNIKAGIKLGKMTSPFGRCYIPIMSNDRRDAPFIRTESVLWRETGAMFYANTTHFDLEGGIFNGCTGLDTNSMKAFIGRAGIKFDNFQAGASFKWQDGIGSEERKEYKNHFGVDASFKFGGWCLSGEAIYDEYGMRRNFDFNAVSWEKSIYYRQITKYHDGINNSEPIHGVGYYIDLNYRGGGGIWLLDFNYGEFYPEKLNNPAYPLHDKVNRRFLVKIQRHLGKYAALYGGASLETDGYTAQCGRPRRGYFLFAGFTFTL